jgi:hypothetical protein
MSDSLMIYRELQDETDQNKMIHDLDQKLNSHEDSLKFYFPLMSLSTNCIFKH